MLKLIAGLISILLFLFAGIYKSRQLYWRVHALESFCKMIQKAKTRIMYRKDPVHVVFRELLPQTDDIAYELAHKISMDKAEDFNEICLCCSHRSYMTEKDEILLRDFGSFLGKSDCDSQIEQLMLIENECRDVLREAVSEYRKKGKMYISASLCIGIWLVILII